MSNLTKTKLINTLEVNALANQKLYFTLPHGIINDERKKFFFHSSSMEDGRLIHAIVEADLFGRQMNIDKITSKYILLYDFDMFGNKQDVKIALDQIEITKQ